MLLLLSYFSRVRLCVTPQMAAHQAALSLGFSRQEHWSGLPFPSPTHESEKWKWSHRVMSNCQWPHGRQPTRLLHPWGAITFSSLTFIACCNCDSEISIIWSIIFDWHCCESVSLLWEHSFLKKLQSKMCHDIFSLITNFLEFLKSWGMVRHGESMGLKLPQTLILKGKSELQYIQYYPLISHYLPLDS